MKNRTAKTSEHGLVLLSLMMLGQAASVNVAPPASCRETKASAQSTCEAVKAHIKINAPSDVVWQVVHEERKHDPDIAYSKTISEGDNEFLLEQKFALIPVIGTSVCQMHQKEIPGSRIDYKLIKSDRFKVMEGSWILTPSADNQSTTLELSTKLDLGIPVPRGVMNHVTTKKLERRLSHIKDMAEKECRAAGKVAEAKKSVH
ncbi:MAG: hypothetical protein JST01_06240 [Cyanobacteria bacterium SZAS TMP-1]|nr:hypothetical protein [Cyanobacteria bacterium SZAS TMP-1]